MANRSSPESGGYISPEYAAELGRQVDELEAENAALRHALIEILDAVDDMRLVNRLKDIERIAIAAINPSTLTAGKRETP